MAANYYLLCSECKVFIDLHKWPVNDSNAKELIDSFYSNPEKSIQSEICSSPSVVFDHLKASKILETIHSVSYARQDYIQKLIPGVKSFIKEHADHPLYLVCDMGLRPWDIGEKNWHKWKELRIVFDYNARFLPRNLVEDYEFKNWEEVIEFYNNEEAWFLHNQMKDQLDELELRYNNIIKSGKY